VYPIADLRGLVLIPYGALQDMAIREASPLGHRSTLPADGDRRVPSMSQESGPPEPPKPPPPQPRPPRHRDPAGVRSPADRMLM
jgi:hypothetical protein